jgi:hypothetical protein
MEIKEIIGSTRLSSACTIQTEVAIFYFVGWTLKPKPSSKDESTKPTATRTPKEKHKRKKDSTPPGKESQKDNSFREFRRLCAALSDTDSYNGKTALVSEFFTKGTDGCEYRNL